MTLLTAHPGAVDDLERGCDLIQRAFTTTTAIHRLESDDA